LVVYLPSEKYAKVSWDDEIPNIWKVIKFHGSKLPARVSLMSVHGEIIPNQPCEQGGGQVIYTVSEM